MEAIPIGAVEYVCVGLGDYYERPANSEHPFNILYSIIVSRIIVNFFAYLKKVIVASEFRYEESSPLQTSLTGLVRV